MKDEDITFTDRLVAYGLVIFFIICFLYTFPPSDKKESCARDAKMMQEDYKFSHGVCYIQQGDRYYPEGMLKHVTVGDEDFES